MTAWISSLLSAVPAEDKRRKPSVILAAIALDDARVTVEDLMSGVTIVTALSPALRGAIEALVLTVLDTRPLPWDEQDTSDAVLVVSSPRGQTGWRQSASDTGRAAVVLVSCIEDVHPKQAVATADRIVAIDGQFLPGSLEAAIFAVTGEYMELEDHWPRVSFDDAVACIQRSSTALECATRLHRLITDRQRVEEEAARTTVAEPTVVLGQAASGVVRKLSEMSGFGDAGLWGLQLAKDVRAYARGELAWSEVDKGILLSGPPGSGKTTFGRALAMEAGVDCVSTTYTEWSSAGGSVGDSMSKGMTKLFDTWRKKAAVAPFILLVDEIDTMGRRGGNDHNESWFTSIINSWLAFLDGAVPRNGIVVVAATNHPGNVDPALMRPGRLDRVIELPYPGIDAMAGIVRHHLGPDATIDDAELAQAARACRGLSPAMVELLCREARRAARVLYRRRVSAVDVSMVIGAKRLQALQAPGAAALDRIIAVHEAGHALAMLTLPGDRLIEVDLDRSQTIGRTPEGLCLVQVEGLLTMLLSGMAAEQVLLGRHTSGVSQDLREATAVAASAQSLWGMGERGLISLSQDAAMADPVVLDAVDDILRKAHSTAIALVTESREAVTRLADTLQRDRYLDASEVRAVVAGEAPEPEHRPTVRRGRHPTP